MGLLSTLTCSGDGYHDFGTPNQRLSDLVWKMTAWPINQRNVDTNIPAQVTRVGYLAYGTSDNTPYTDRTNWAVGEYRYVSFRHEDWNLLNDSRGDMQFVQWHLLPGYTLALSVYVY